MTTRRLAKSQISLPSLFLLLGLFGWSPHALSEDPSKVEKEVAISIDRDHRKLVREHLQLTPKEAEAFWPVFEDYTVQVDRFLKLRLNYANHLAERFENFDDAVGEEVITDLLAIDKTHGEIWSEYLPRFIKAVGGRKAARFYQLERRIRIYVDAELSHEFPLIP